MNQIRSHLWLVWPLIILAALGFFIVKTNFFRVKKITCRLETYPCPLTYEPVLVNLVGKNIFTLSRSALTDQLVSVDSTLTDIQLQKKLPNQLIIALRSRQAIAQIAPFAGLDFTASLSGSLINQFWFLDEKGEIFNQSSQRLAHLPLIAVPEDFSASGDNDLTQQLSLLITTLEEYYVSYELIALVKSPLVVIKTTLGPYAVLNLSDRLANQVGSLQYVLSQSKIEDKLPTKIDLRFDKPVISF